MKYESKYLYAGTPAATTVIAVEPVGGGREKITFKYDHDSLTHHKVCRIGVWAFGTRCWTQSSYYSDGRVENYVYRESNVALSGD